MHDTDPCPRSCRYARRGLTNVLNESTNEEFKQTVLMLKMMETNLIEEIRQAANIYSIGGETAHNGQSRNDDSGKCRSSTEKQLQKMCETLAEVAEKLDQVAQGQTRLEAHTCGALQKIPELSQKLDRVAQGPRRLKQSTVGDALNVIPDTKQTKFIQTSSAHSTKSRVGRHVDSTPNNMEKGVGSRARSPVENLFSYGLVHVFLSHQHSNKHAALH